MSKSNKKTMKHTPVSEDVYESDSSESSESVDEVVPHKKSIEYVKQKEGKSKLKTLKPVEVVDIVKVIKKPMSEAQSQALLNARLKRSEKFKLQREKTERDKQSIQLIYEQNMEDNLRKTMIPKYEKQIKKQILERLKDEKLNELKKQYGLKNKTKARRQVESSESSSSESSEEETVIVKKKKSTKYPPPTAPPVSAVKSKPSVIKHSIFDAYRDMGF